MKENYPTLNLSKTESDGFYIIKFFAILSVIAVHVCNYVDNKGILITAITDFWSMFARCGVVVFFILSGFFYSRKQGDGKLFWQKKSLQIILPWIICATATYALSVVLTHKISVLGYIKWTLGSGSWYYYLTVMVILFAAFKLIGNKDILLYACIAINLISIALYTFGINYIDGGFITKYLNLFNWIGFFALGMLMRKYRFDIRILKSKMPLVICIVIFAASLFINAKIKIFTYFNLFTVVYTLAVFVILIYVGDAIARIKHNKMLITLGKDTFFIYLVHMQIVQIISARIPSCTAKYLFDPIIGLAVMSLITLALKYLFQLFPFGKKLLSLVGIK